MLRGLVERFSRGRVIKRRLPAAFGKTPLFVSPDAQLKYLRPGATGFDEELLKLAMDEVRAQSIVWDVGANVGVFSIAAAHLASNGGVLAIEPDTWLVDVIRRSLNLSNNKQLNVKVLPVAVSDKVGTATLLIAQRGRASNALESVGGRDQMGGVRERVVVPTLTLDFILADHPAPDLVKIDVEGAELQVLEGAVRLLETARPKVYIEVGDSVCDAITSIFAKHEYLLFDPSSPGNKRRRIERCLFNTLAVPKELGASIAS